MTWITDGTGTNWVDIPVRKRRKSPRAVRFANVKVGDQLMKIWKDIVRGGPVTWYYVVTDLWFDPVKGQDSPVAGEMVGLRQIKPSGDLYQRKEPHTKRGLASQGFHYADRDFVAFAKQRMEAENIVGIGFGKVIRQRPKRAGGRL